MNATEAKRRVLAVHPGALLVYRRLFGYIVVNGPDPVEGRAKFYSRANDAYVAAAAGLEDRNER